VRFGPISGRTDPMSGQPRRVMRTLVLVTAVAGVIGGFSARPAGAYVARVQLANQRFDPPRVEIQLGDSVIWEAGDDGHTVTARDESFDSSDRGLMAEGDQFRWRFRVPGTFAYYCRVHQNRGMVGEVVVIDPSDPTSTTRLTPVTAAATTSTIADDSTTTTAPVTTTSRELATSSTTSLRQATSTTMLPGVPADPQEAPTMNPNAPILTGAGSSVLPDARPAASARRSDAAKKDRLPVVAVVAIAALTLFGGVAGVRTHRRRSAP
jgi:plastocyanin